MGPGLCQCTSHGFWYDPSSSVGSAIELLIISLIGTVCIIVNYKFRKKLKEEKKKRPLGRKGNVIEPLMSWYCIILMFGTTYRQLLHWQFANEIIPLHLIPEWMCILLMTLDRCIVSSIAYNSLLIVFIRYVYIVHCQKANRWDFERVGKMFQFMSIIIPSAMEIVHLCINSRNAYFAKKALDMGKAKFESCSDSFMENTSTFSSTLPNDPSLGPLFLTLIPQGVILAAYYFYVIVTALVFLNIVEVFLYIKIFSCIKRSNLDSFKKGVYNESSYNSLERRRMTSIGVCFLGWLLEVFLTVLVGLFTLLKDLGLEKGLFYPYFEFFQAFFRAIVIPFVHLINDEETKTVITEEGWYNGIKYALGLYRKPDINSN